MRWRDDEVFHPGRETCFQVDEDALNGKVKGVPAFWRHLFQGQRVQSERMRNCAVGVNFVAGEISVDQSDQSPQISEFVDFLHISNRSNLCVCLIASLLAGCHLFANIVSISFSFTISFDLLSCLSFKQWRLQPIIQQSTSPLTTE